MDIFDIISIWYELSRGFPANYVIFESGTIISVKGEVESPALCSATLKQPLTQPLTPEHMELFALFDAKEIPDYKEIADNLTLQLESEVGHYIAEAVGILLQEIPIGIYDIKAAHIDDFSLISFLNGVNIVESSVEINNTSIANTTVANTAINARISDILVPLAAAVITHEGEIIICIKN